MKTFKTGEIYGNDLTIEIIKRTEKTVTIKTNAWGISRVKIREFHNGIESIYFKAWIIDATEKYDFEEAKKISFEKAYN